SRICSAYAVSSAVPPHLPQEPSLSWVDRTHWTARRTAGALRSPPYRCRASTQQTVAYHGEACHLSVQYPSGCCCLTIHSTTAATAAASPPGAGPPYRTRCPKASSTCALVVTDGVRSPGHVWKYPSARYSHRQSRSTGRPRWRSASRTTEV